MRKGITKEQIVGAALELADEGQSLRSTGFRDIARRLGCAHTNLYNYFDSYDALLWAAKEEILHLVYRATDERLKCTTAPEDALEAFFGAVLDAYLAHNGWFYLAWFEKQDTPRPHSHYDLTVSTVDSMVDSLAAVFAGAGIPD